MKKFLSILLGALMLVPFVACGQTGGSIKGELEQNDVTTGFLRTAGQDDFGRSFTETETFNKNYVGIFYFLWLSQASSKVTVEEWNAAGKAEYTLSGEEDPDTGEHVPSMPSFTWWGEPMYGYYRVEDKWVVRKHVELFINAGLDFLCFDTTNNDYYQRAAQTVLDILLEYSDLGYRVPKAMFMTNSDSSGRIKSIYNAFYKDDRYDDIWFTGGGDKPWILGSRPCDDETIMDRFYFKHSQWPNEAISPEGFPWMDWNYPQQIYTDAEHDLTIVNVSVSQHLGIQHGVNFSLSGLCSPSVFPTVSEELQQKIGGESRAEYYYNENWGRGYSHKTKKNNRDDISKNVNFEEQWQLPLDNGDINLVFVTGWNEWIAQRQVDEPMLGGEYGYYVDTYNMEFSRDLEMMAGGYLDNAYLSLVRNVRAYKGMGSRQTENGKTSADLFRLENWQNAAAYADFVKETLPRNDRGAGGSLYKNDTGRNDIREVRVATTDDSVWFLVSAVDDITKREEGDARWMNLWIGVNGAQGGWNGLQYVVNRSSEGGKASVDRIENGKYTAIGECDITVSGRFMIIKVSKDLLGINGDKFGLQFKVTDNLQKDFDITDLYTNGDCAPIGRVNYSYYAK